MICSKCGHDNVQKPHSLDPWCMYQVKGGVVINAMFLPDRIPEGWYDSPKAAVKAESMKIISNPKAARNALIENATEHDLMEWDEVEPKEINVKIDGRTKEGRKLKAKTNDHSTGTN